MQSGKLRERIDIQAPVETIASNGDRTRSWLTTKSVWAEVRALTERSHTEEKFSDHQVNTYVGYDFTTRGLTGVDTTMRVLFEGRIFDIQAVVQEKLLGRMTILHCVERQDAGSDY